MKKTIVFAALLALLFLTDSCQALHRGIPKAHKSRGEREVVLTEGETTVLRNVREADALPTEDPQTFISEEETTASTDTKTVATDSPVSIAVKPDLFHDDTVRIVESDPSSEDMIDEALASERSAKNAHAFSFVTLSGLIFLPGLLIGLIGTLICLSNFNKFEFVTDKALDYARRAKNTLIVTTAVVVALYLFIFLLIFAVL